ncbi:MAG: hypothetical protein U0640_07935 [Phycisphaerales bacterium]
MNTTARKIIVASSLLMAGSVLAQSTVDTTNKFSWSENCGWMNWRDAGNPQASQGVRLALSGTHLSGFVWCENIGWMNFGDGTPANGVSYANATGADFGVNVDPVTGNLSGLAWGENVGWINFSGGMLANGVTTAARYDVGAQRMRGYAWGENIGWINLNLAEQGKFVGMGSGCDSIDFNNDGSFFDPQDIDAFLSVYSEGPCIPAAATCNDIDFNNDTSVFDPCDINAFLLVYSEGPCTPCGQ